jgi:hypothetical protein
VYNRLSLLSKHFDVYTAGFESSYLEGITHFTIVPSFKKMNFWGKAFNALLFLFRLFETSYEHLYDYEELKKGVCNETFDLIIFHDLKTLPLWKRLFNHYPTNKILFDAHEFYMRHNDNSLTSRLLIAPFDEYLYKTYFLKLENVITVGSFIAAAYEKELGRKVEVIYNSAKFWDLSPHPVDGSKIKLIHHGMADPNRQTELMIEMMNYCDERFHLDIMLKATTLGGDNYIKKLIKLSKGNPRVRILDPIDSEKTISFSNQYDIAVYLLPDTIDNFLYALPNKFFEFIQSRLMIAISPNVEMKKLTEEYNLGIVSPDFTPKSFANELNKLSTEQIWQFKQNTHLAASKLCFEAQNDKILSLISRLTQH